MPAGDSYGCLYYGFCGFPELAQAGELDYLFGNYALQFYVSAPPCVRRGQSPDAELSSAEERVRLASPLPIVAVEHRILLATTIRGKRAKTRWEMGQGENVAQKEE